MIRNRQTKTQKDKQQTLKDRNGNVKKNRTEKYTRMSTDTQTDELTDRSTHKELR